MGMESFNNMPVESPRPEDSERVDDVEKARAMAEAGDKDRTKVAEENKINDGKEFSAFKNHERYAESAEDIAGAKYEMQERAKNMSKSELINERVKIAQLLGVLQEEEKSRGFRE